MKSFQKNFQVGGCFIYGRADDIYRITKLLSSEDRTGINSAIVSVVADRGTGRTTLLHLLHNELCSKFDITKYICMPENFDEKGIIRLIVESLTGSGCDITDLEVLKEIVKEELLDQRLLLLLDDFENKSQNNWDLLLALLKICKKRSAVVVTATKEAVAKVKGPIQFYCMSNLSKEWCWMIFKQSVFSGQNPDVDIELADIGKCLVAKCRNVTLCIKVLSGVLRCSIAVDSWRAVLDTNLWEMGEVNEGILPALSVCYEYLPFHLKQCFRYCSLFPKEYIFSKKHLVLIWLSQGFILPGEGRELEEIGLEYFDQLLSRSFLQASLIPGMKEDTFVMPGLIHELARQLSKNECFQIEGCLQRAPENACHLALVPHEFQLVLLSHLTTRPQNLQTILVVSRCAFQHQSVSSILKLAELEDLFMKFRRLITLDLSNADVKALPESLGSLINLRYLSLSHTNIKRIPLEISNLIHLQTLEAKDCHFLGELPRTIEALTNLHYLDVTKEAGYVVMPHGIGKLTNLRSLETFNVGMDSLLHCGIQELKDMEHLKGCLEISGLVNVRRGVDAKKADLRSKEHIETLCFQWSDGMPLLGEEGAEIAEEVLENLHPTENLNEIIVRNYPGRSFPTWIEYAAFSRLVSIIFDNCNNCERLPALGGLPLLRFLSIQKMYCVQRMSLSGSEYIPENIIRYPSLEQLTIWEMYELVEWIEVGNGHFPILHSLCINRCPLLRNVPKFPALIELSVCSCAQFLEATDLPSLQSLRIEGLQKTRSFFLPKKLVRLNKLEISHCPELLSIEGTSLLNTLKTIIIFRCAQFNPSGILDERFFAYEDRGNTSRVWLCKNSIDKLDFGSSAMSDERREHPIILKERKKLLNNIAAQMSGTEATLIVPGATVGIKFWNWWQDRKSKSTEDNVYVALLSESKETIGLIKKAKDILDKPKKGHNLGVLKDLAAKQMEAAACVDAVNFKSKNVSGVEITWEQIKGVRSELESMLKSLTGPNQPSGHENEIAADMPPGNVRRCLLYLTYFHKNHVLNRKRITRLCTVLEDSKEPLLQQVALADWIEVVDTDGDGPTPSHFRIGNAVSNKRLTWPETYWFSSDNALESSGSIPDGGGSSSFCAIGKKLETVTLFPLVRILTLRNVELQNEKYLKKLTLLRYLDLKHSSIWSCDWLEGLEELQVLDLRHTAIKKIPSKYLEKLLNLKHLLLGYTPSRSRKRLVGVELNFEKLKTQNLETLRAVFSWAEKTIVENGRVRHIDVRGVEKVHDLSVTSLTGKILRHFWNAVINFQNLTSLGVAMSDSSDPLRDCPDQLKQKLKRLKLEGRFSNEGLEKLSAFQSLVDLTMASSASGSSRIQINQIEFPQTLLCLRLYGVCDENPLKFEEGFKELKKLVIGDMKNVETIKISNAVIKTVTTLKLCDLPNLRELVSLKSGGERLILSRIREDQKGKSTTNDFEDVKPINIFLRGDYQHLPGSSKGKGKGIESSSSGDAVFHKSPRLKIYRYDMNKQCYEEIKK